MVYSSPSPSLRAGDFCRSSKTVRQRGNSVSFTCLFYSGHQPMERGPTRLGRAVCLTQSTESEVSFNQEHPHRPSECCVTSEGDAEATSTYLLTLLSCKVISLLQTVWKVPLHRSSRGPGYVAHSSRVLRAVSRLHEADVTASRRKGLPTPSADRMTQTRLFRLWLVLGSVFMVLLIIVYWDNVGTAHFYLHTSFPRPHPLEPLPTPLHGPQKEFASDVDVFLQKLLGGGLKQNALSGKRTEQPSVPASSRPVLSNAEESVRGYDWSTRDAQQGPDPGGQQAERRSVLRGLCANASFVFPAKERSFDDIPNYELNHLIVDDRHGVIYCYVPKVACTNWKRVMIVLSESLLDRGAPYRDPLDIPREYVHNSSTHLTFNKFWRRYGKFSRHLMKIKLKKYTKFLFVRDPFVRLISAFRSKFQLENEEFYRKFAVPMLKMYANHTGLPASVSEAFSAGLKVSFANFIQYLLDPRTEKLAPFNEHWRQVHRLCHPCQIDYDFVGKLETLEQDAAQLLRLLKVDKLLHFPPSYRNRTASSWEEHWFATIPLAWRQQLYKLYEADFVLFGYPKPENLLRD
uniref:Carbohydrate sulfotransferase n=4 Tax=Ursus TaxID=9639 RepID=A0A452TN90_URSMA